MMTNNDTTLSSDLLSSELKDKSTDSRGHSISCRNFSVTAVMQKQAVLLSSLLWARFSSAMELMRSKSEQMSGMLALSSRLWLTFIIWMPGRVESTWARGPKDLESKPQFFKLTFTNGAWVRADCNKRVIRTVGFSVDSASSESASEPPG